MDKYDCTWKENAFLDLNWIKKCTHLGFLISALTHCSFFVARNALLCAWIVTWMRGTWYQEHTAAACKGSACDHSKQTIKADCLSSNSIHYQL